MRGDQVGLRETIVQTLAFSWLLVAWYRRPHRAWAPVLYGLTGFGVLLSFAGWLAATAAPR